MAGLPASCYTLPSPLPLSVVIPLGKDLPYAMVSALVTQYLDLSGEQDFGITTVAVDRRMCHVNSRCYGDQPRRATCFRCRRAISQNHHLCFSECDVVDGSWRVARSQAAADATTAGRRFPIFVLRVAEPIQALDFGRRPTVPAV